MPDHIIFIICSVASILFVLPLTTISSNIVEASFNETSSDSSSFANITEYEFIKKWGGEGDEEG